MMGPRGLPGLPSSLPLCSTPLYNGMGQPTRAGRASALTQHSHPKSYPRLAAPGGRGVWGP